ncbi:MAG: VCBS repeat-containing protein [Ginsengibacter sp.]
MLLKIRRLLKNLFLIFFSSLISICCQKKYHRNESHKNVSYVSIEAGEKLAQQYCQSCHLLPDPSLANAISWEKGILPNMGPHLGIFFYGFQEYPSFRNAANINSGSYPSSPVVNFVEWQNIIDYYTATSPDSMPAQDRQLAIDTGLSLFSPELPSYIYHNAATSFIHIDSIGKKYSLVICDAVTLMTYFFDRTLKVIDSIHNPGPVVNIDFNRDTLLACNIGVMIPNNGKFGKAEIIAEGINKKFSEEQEPLLDSLRRPVQVTAVDLNADGKTDYLICEFGFVSGALSWKENKGNGKFINHILRSLPGAIKAYVNDYNHDGLPDIWVLFAQGDECVVLFTNQGNGKFSEEKVLRFPPSYGSSYFELDDFNNDGYPDIVYTCGDNADYSPVLKPYHGVYIFLNDKENHFTQKFFFPINGCYKAIAKDFDGDGDLDIAAISFFADYIHQPGEGFVYLKNNGSFNFIPYTLKAAEMGRWLTMDAGDINGDGKPDIVLGNFSLGPVLHRPQTDWKQAPSFLVLKNTGK